MSSETFIRIYDIKDDQLCDDLIKYFQSHKEEYGMPGEAGGKLDKNWKDSTDVYFYNESRDKTIKKFFKTLSMCVTDYTERYKMQNKVFTVQSNKLQHYPPGGGFKIDHYERSAKEPDRQLVYMLYLNTVKDQGGTEFLYQNTITSAIKGHMVIWPAEFTHRHRGVVSPTEEKYIATGWFNIVKEGLI